MAMRRMHRHCTREGRRREERGREGEGSLLGGDSMTVCSSCCQHCTFSIHRIVICMHAVSSSAVLGNRMWLM